ncbi:MAG TPA: hypothetical protein V6D14_11235 [Coleofasciculaceae cyanobacterium]
MIENWEVQDQPEHLKTIRDRLFRCARRDRLLRSGSSTARLLKLYQQILQQGEIVANNSSEQIELHLSGLVVKQLRGSTHALPVLNVCNRVYQAVFNPSWLRNQLY